jgi:hypothetical protein
MRPALTHPAALGLLACSVLLFVATLLVPALRPWADRAVWILVWGAVAYAAAAFILSRSVPKAPSVTSPELRQLRAIRQAISTLIGESAAVERSQLGGVLAEAVDRIDYDIEPALQELVQRHRMLSRDLGRYERKELPLPDPGVMDRLWAIHARQRAAIDECIQQAANAQAALVALLREGDSHVMAARAREWVDDLLTLHDSLDEVLRGGEAVEPAMEMEPMRPGLVTRAQVPDDIADSVAPSHNGHHPEDQVPDGAVPYASKSPPISQLPDEKVVRLVEEALRRLQNPGALASCELIEWIPASLAAAASDGAFNQTPLARGRALRSVLDSAIEGLTDPAGGAALQHAIIHEEYQVGRSNKEIAAPHQREHAPPLSAGCHHRHRARGAAPRGRADAADDRQRRVRDEIRQHSNAE